MPLWCIFIYTHMDNYNIENNNEQHECCMHGPGPDLHCSCVTTGNCSGADYKMFEWDYKCPTCTFHPDPFKRLQCFIRALATKGLASEKKIEEIEKILNGDDNVEGLIDKVESMLTDATIIDDHLDDDSANPVQNNVIKEAIDELRASLRQKQDTLASGINIKTINGYPILGSGDISVGGETTWDSVTNKPTFATVATTGSYADLVGKPNLAAVAFSGSYNDLLNKPAPGSDIVVDAQLSNTSENPVQNKVVAEEISSLSGACNNLQMNKQQKLTSDTVLGTINGQSLTYGGSVSIATGGGADVKTFVDFDYGTGEKRGTDLTEVINTVNYSGTCSSQIMDSDSHTKILNAQIDVVYFNAKNESGSFSRQTARLQVNITYSNGTYDIGDVATKFATLGDFTLYGRPYLEVTQNSSDQTKADINMYFCLTSAKLQIHSLTIELHNDNGQLPYFVQTRNDIDHNYTYSNNKKVVYFDTWDNVIVIFINGKWYKLADADPFPLRPMSGS